MCILLLLILGCSSSANFANLQAKLAAVELQLLQVQKQTAEKTDLENLSASLREQLQTLLKAQADASSDLKELASEVERLQAKLDDSSFRLTQLNQQLAATLQELQEARNAAQRAQMSAQASKPPAEPGNPQALYDTAYEDYQRGSYDLAILGFRQFLDAFPDSELADNATYWIGECYYWQKKLQQAIAQFDELLTRFAASDRIPSALLKKGFAYLELGQRAQGVVQLQRVICEHAETDEARLARQHLQELGIDVEC